MPGTKNKLINLNDHLFEQLERINDNSLSREDLSKEIIKAKSMCQIAEQIISNGALQLEASKFAHHAKLEKPVFPEMLEYRK